MGLKLGGRKSGKRILGGVRQALGLVVGNVRNAQELEHLKQRLAVMAEGHRTVVRVALLNQPISGMANTAMPPKLRVATGRISPCAM